MRVKISPTIADSWQARGICSVIDGLPDRIGPDGRLYVEPAVGNKILADASQMANEAEDAGVRCAYRALVHQINLIRVDLNGQ